MQVKSILQVYLIVSVTCPEESYGLSEPGGNSIKPVDIFCAPGEDD